MPKRKNPFGDTAPIQLKTHVGFKQVATVEEKQEVYEKTVALLFQGANPHLKKTPVVFTSINGTANGCNGRSNGYHNHSNGHSLQLNGASEMSSDLDLEKCISCGKGIVSQHFSCSHCHRRVCSEPCLRLCCICNQPYCHYCSVLNYESDVRALCFDCLPVNS